MFKRLIRSLSDQVEKDVEIVPIVGATFTVLVCAMNMARIKMKKTPIIAYDEDFEKRINRYDL